MSQGAAAVGGESASAEHGAPANAAWAKAALPLSPQGTFTFLADIERLFRLNPHLDISAWHEEPGTPRRCTFSAFNETNGCRYEVTVGMENVRENRGMTLVYDRGLKASTEFRIEPAGNGSSLTITEHYHPVADRNDERLKEVDRSLVPWLAAIRGHIAGLARYGWLPGYRWWAGRFMPGMPPRQRRIVRMIVWISLLEFVVFLFVAAVFWLETRGA